jgi:hypothetical protein
VIEIFRSQGDTVEVVERNGEPRYILAGVKGELTARQLVEELEAAYGYELGLISTEDYEAMMEGR